MGEKPDGTAAPLGSLSVNLTIGTGAFHNLYRARDDSIEIFGSLDLNGHTLNLRAENIILHDAAAVSTGNPGGQAGAITLNGLTIKIGTNANGSVSQARLLALGSTLATSGDIAINAIDDQSLWTPFMDVDRSNVDFFLARGAQIKGRDVTILASADNRKVCDAEGAAGGAGDFFGTLLEGLLTFEATVAWVKSAAHIDLQPASVIEARNFIAYASSYAKIVATPLASLLGGAAVGVIRTTAQVDAAGTITTTGDLTIKATTDHWLDLLNDNTAMAGVAAGVGLGLLFSHCNAIVTDDAVLHVGGSLYVVADTIDRTRVLARSPAGKDGTVGVAFAITVEDGETNAWLDGTATVGGDVEVWATMVQESVPLNKIFAIPSYDVGTIAQAGVGSNSKGDIMDDTKSMITSVISNLIKQYLVPMLGGLATTIYEGIKSKFPGYYDDLFEPKDPKPPSEPGAAIQFAGGIAVVVDTNRTTARIGDGNADLDGKNGGVDAGGYVWVYSSVASQPWISASASTEANPDTKSSSGNDKWSVSGSVAVAVGIYKNDARAYIGAGAKVDAGGALTVNCETYSNYKFTWFKNLVDVWLQQATFATDDDVQHVKVHTGDTVEVRGNHTGGGDVGTWYQYLGITPRDITLATEDFTDENLWLANNPIIYKGSEFLRLFTTYFTGDFGLSHWLANSMSNATAVGADLSIAGAITFLFLKQNAEAVIHSGALINQHTGTGQAVTVKAVNHNEAVNLGGNVSIPSLQIAADKTKSRTFFKKLWGGIDLAIDTIGLPINPKSWEKTKQWWKEALPKRLVGTQAKKGAVGIALLGYYFDDTTTATIEDGVRLYADSLYVDAETHVLSVDVGASGGKSGNVGFNGAVVVNVVVNETHAQIARGAVIEVGSALVFDPAGSPPENGSIIVHASDDTLVIALEGGVAMSEHVGIGGSVGVNVVMRDTEAAIGDLKDDQPAPLAAGSLTAGGDVLVHAANSGFVGNFAVAGSKAVGNPGPQQDPSEKSESQQLLDALNSVVKSKDKKDSTGGVPSDAAGGASQQPKAGVAISGSVAVDVIDDDALAYVLNAGNIVAAGGLDLDARNTTSVGSLAGAVAYAKASYDKRSVGIAGAFGINVLTGDTKAFIDKVSSLTLHALDIEAVRSGWTVSLTAGFGIAAGNKGTAVGGSVGVNITDYTVEALLQNINFLDVRGAMRLNADDDTNLIAIAGAGGFGSKAGVGVAFAVCYTGNTVTAQIWNVYSFKYTAGLQVLATANDLIVSVTASLGIAKGAKFQEGSGYAAEEPSR